MEVYQKPEMEIIDIDNEAILTGVKWCGSGNYNDQEASMANFF